MYRHLTIVAAFALVAAFQLVPVEARAAESDWIVEAEQAEKLIESGEATVLDTRGESKWKAGHVPGAVAVDWKDFSKAEESKKGELLDAGALTEKLRKVGVSKDAPVLVVGNPPDNWGEDGRIVWMLRALGHPKAMLVDGGHGALTAAGIEPTKEKTDVEPGDFEASSTHRFSVDADGLKERLGDDDSVIVDTREPREFKGETPYGESRGGHVPGAKHLHYADLLDDEGRLLSDAKIKEKLADAGIEPDDQVVAYCTGGVRSAWLTVILAHLGYDDVVNYPGSMWDWAARDADAYPLK